MLDLAGEEGVNVSDVLCNMSVFFESRIRNFIWAFDMSDSIFPCKRSWLNEALRRSYACLLRMSYLIDLECTNCSGLSEHHSPWLFLWGFLSASIKMSREPNRLNILLMMKLTCLSWTLVPRYVPSTTYPIPPTPSYSKIHNFRVMQNRSDEKSKHCHAQILLLSIHPSLKIFNLGVFLLKH